MKLPKWGGQGEQAVPAHFIGYESSALAVALPGHFGMDNIASYPERHDSQFPGRTMAYSSKFPY
ncbi:hypothetical protein [Pseudovibrio sp. Ad5]|uniref:hypothetical protein n=1 Tax=Pseudovibrio sp. Ad5 TaxID=989436 RepID=UPI000A745096|nr:hypothetical protein [Pseudovibrio sp. Ad5]